MAAEVDRGALTPPAAAAPPRRRYRLLLRLIGAVLIGSFIGVTWVQWRQVNLLRGTMQEQDDYLVWSLFQLETEYLRLRGELQRAADRGGFDPAGLQLRYDIFVSRIGIVELDRVKRSLRISEPYQRMVADLRRFTTRADRYFAGSSPETLTAEALESLLDDLDALQSQIREFSVNESHHVSQQQAYRNTTVRDQSQLGIGLAVFQGVLTLLFAGVAVLQLRELMRQRERQDALVQSLHAARLDAEAANRAKTVFLANMSHEIRTPFHGLLGMLALLRDTPLDERQRDYLATAGDSARHLLAILNDILDISRIESENLQIVAEPVDLPALVRDVEQLMRPMAIERRLGFSLRIAGDVPPWVQVDPTRLRQILFNLTSNALKFCEAGSVGVTVSREAGDPGESGGDRLVLSVRDTGIGMDEDTLARLFQRFSQGDESTARRFGGTGLGLQISRSLALMMGGDIEVRSAPGQGSTFVLRIPLVPAAAPAPTRAEPVGLAAPSGGLRLCVVEDHVVNRKYLAALLDQLGHVATLCEDGRQAVDALREASFDLVLMDLHMPGMDGLTAAREIRALPAPASRVPIVMLTADAFEATRRRVLAAGVDDFMTKPVGREELQQVLARHCGRPPVAMSATSAAPVAARSRSDELFDTITLDRLQSVLSSGRLDDVMRLFFGDASRAFERLDDAIRVGDRDGTRAHAHAIKGAALSLGLLAVSEAARELETAAREDRMQESPHLARALQHRVQTTRAVCASRGWLGA